MTPAEKLVAIVEAGKPNPALLTRMEAHYPNSEYAGQLRAERAEWQAARDLLTSLLRQEAFWEREIVRALSEIKTEQEAGSANAPTYEEMRLDKEAERLAETQTPERDPG